MFKNNIIMNLVLFFSMLNCYAQNTFTIEGSVIDDRGIPISDVNISILGTDRGTISDFNGNFTLDLKAGKTTIQFKAMGYRTLERVIVPEDYRHRSITVKMMEDAFGLDQVVITGTRDRVATKTAPVVVNSIKPKLFDAGNSSTMSESLNFTPGVRLETNCQNCNTTQVRMNGVGGAYSQLLLNARPSSEEHTSEGQPRFD